MAEGESWEERWGSRPGPRCLGASLAPHGGRIPCRSRDRDYNDIDDDDPFNPQARRIAAYIPSRGRLPSFCSYSGSLDSQPGLQPPAQTVSNAPVSEYMYGRAPRPPGPPPPQGARSAGPKGQVIPSLQPWGAGRKAPRSSQSHDPCRATCAEGRTHRRGQASPSHPVGLGAENLYFFRPRCPWATPSPHPPAHTPSLSPSPCPPPPSRRHAHGTLL